MIIYRTVIEVMDEGHPVADGLRMFSNEADIRDMVELLEPPYSGIKWRIVSFDKKWVVAPDQPQPAVEGDPD